jgi:polyphosphate kinase 2 (PPK2 family)
MPAAGEIVIFDRSAYKASSALRNSAPEATPKLEKAMVGSPFQLIK